MANSTFRYILRYQIDPLFHADDRIEELLEFCDQARVEEVMLFFTAEELSTGHPTQEELEPYVSLAKRLKSKLSAADIDISLNPWTTTYHVSRGRTLRRDQHFTTMVGENGYASPIASCPLCQNWQQWLCDTFAYLVKEIQPTALWVEDDWRLHNHEPEMNWGGCFCDLHLNRFSSTIGQKVTREELIKKVLAPGNPHPWRKIWLELWKNSLLEPADKLKGAIHNACPKTRLALMSSDPDTHSIEGRDWHAMQKAFGAEPVFLARPHFPPYTQQPAMQVPPVIPRHTIANIAKPHKIYPELDDGPRSGLYTKSHAFNIWQCLHSSCFGSQGITINHHDMMGNGVALDPDYHKALASAKDRLNTIAALGIDDNNTQGVQVLYSPRVAANRRCMNGDSFQGLYNHSTIWSNLCYLFGVAHGFTQHVDSDRIQPIAVSDETLWSFNDDQIQQILSGPTLLDATSIDILMQRGFADLLGIKAVNWIKQTKTAYAYEAITEEDPDVYGLAFPRMCAQLCSSRLLGTDTTSAKVHSWIHTAKHEKVTPGMIVNHNDLGGTVVAMAYPLAETNLYAYANVFRQTMMQNTIFDIACDAPLAMVANKPLHIYRTPVEQGLFLAILNPCDDTVCKPRLRLPAGQINPKTIMSLDKENNWTAANCQCHRDGNVDVAELDTAIRHLDAHFVILSNISSSLS